MYIYLNMCKQMTDVKLLLLHRNTWNHVNAGRNELGFTFKDVIHKMCLQIMFKEDLALNNRQWLICHKIQLKQILFNMYV